MDRKLPKEVLRSSKKKMITKWTIAVAALLTLVLLLRFSLSGSVNENEMICDRVIVGNISSTINATGTVLPEFEELFLSPIASKIEKLVASAGKQIKCGDTLLILDRETINLSVQKLRDALEVDKTQMEKHRLSVQKSIKELETNIAIRELRNKSLEAAYLNQKRLFDIGGGTQEELHKAEMELKISQLEYSQMKENLVNLKESSVVEIREKQLQIDIQNKSLGETGKKLADAVVVAHRKGVLTSIVDQIGAEVHDKQELAKVSDLSSFKLKCNIPDTYASKILIGQEVLIKLNDSLLNGKVTTIMPTVNNGIVEFMVALNEKFNPALRPNMKLDVYAVTSYKHGAKTVKNAGFYKGQAQQYAFVRKGEKAERRLIKVGISNFERVEILSGVEAGEELIVSDMKEFENHKELKIKK